jgi:hypothetical protein
MRTTSVEKLRNQNGEDADEQWEALGALPPNRKSMVNSRVRMKAEREHNEWPA